MSQSDSFIDEVTEELRRDQLFRALKRWGWIGILAVVALVGAATYREISTNRDLAAARDFGDAVIAALDLPDAEARVAALAEITPSRSNQEVLLAFIRASDLSESDPVAAAVALRAIADAPDLLPRYRDLALLRAHILAPLEDQGLVDATLARLAEDGAPFAGIAREMQALELLKADDKEGAIAALEALSEQSVVILSQRQRISALIFALQSGATITGQSASSE
ncbi:hypothetical protein [Roseobacter sp. HKCCD7870]|uniref:hypothetical protein n=1 Tax=Roseobacter sp. HKCCD7870 TaxID=3120343 RepID=UPI0030EEF554